MLSKTTNQPAAPGRLLPIGYKTRLDERLRVVLDGMPVGVTWARLEDARIEFVNRKFVQMLGYSLAELPTIFDFFDLCFVDEVQRVRATGATRALLGQTHLKQFDMPDLESELRAKDGTLKTFAFGGVILPETGWMVGTFLDLTDRKERELLMKRLAEEDALTGLLNRRSFDAKLESAIATRREQSVHLVLLDLDGFKQINDSAGHETGDRVLRAVAQALSDVFRHGDHLARIGGDEFAAILVGYDGPVLEVIRRIEEIFDRPLDLGDRQVTLGISIGVAECPRDAADALGLYKAADQAMYRVKERRHAG